MQILDNIFGPIEQTAEYLYQRGATVAAVGGNLSEVLALYQRAVSVDARHQGALFGLAVENDRLGNDFQALEYYQRAANVVPAHVGTLINLGLIYEDRNDFAKAQACYRRVLEVAPDHHVPGCILKTLRQVETSCTMKTRPSETNALLKFSTSQFPISNSRSDLETAFKRWGSERSAIWLAPPKPHCSPARTSAKHRLLKSVKC